MSCWPTTRSTRKPIVSLFWLPPISAWRTRRPPDTPYIKERPSISRAVLSGWIGSRPKLTCKRSFCFVLFCFCHVCTLNIWTFSDHCGVSESRCRSISRETCERAISRQSQAAVMLSSRLASTLWKARTSVSVSKQWRRFTFREIINEIRASWKPGDGRWKRRPAPVGVAYYY